LASILPPLALNNPNNVIRIGIAGPVAIGKSTFARAFRMAHADSRCVAGTRLQSHYESTAGGLLLHYDARKIENARKPNYPEQLEPIDKELLMGKKERTRGGFELVEHPAEDTDKFYNALVSFQYQSDSLRLAKICVPIAAAKSTSFMRFMQDAELEFSPM